MLLLFTYKVTVRRLGAVSRAFSLMHQTDLFEHTGRFLFNEDINRTLRYRPFNVPAMEAIACKSVGAQRVVTWKKIGEGSYNKVFLLGFDNDRRAALRIPNPIVPNIQRTTASEVATMEYIRERWSKASAFPSTPSVLAWNASAQSDVGTPYILVDYLEGVTARQNWYQPETTGDRVASFIYGAAYMERCLLSEPFAFHGALYFVEDVDAALAAQPLYSSQSYADDHKSLARKYRIGPTVDREWYRDVYEQVSAPRGPWTDMHGIVRDAVGLQFRALETGAAFQNPLIRSTREDEQEIIRYLNLVLAVIDVIVPTGPICSRPALNHPDLSLDNMIWERDGEKGLQSVIDWQGTVIHPLCLQSKRAEAFTYRGWHFQVPRNGDKVPFPEGLDSMPAEMQEGLRLEHRIACRHRAYEQIALVLGTDRGLTWALPQINILSNLLPTILRVVADGPRDMREYLLETQERWMDIVSASGNQERPCPIDFSAREADLIRAEVALGQKYEQNVLGLCNAVGCYADGGIDENRFEEGREMAELLQQQWNEGEMGGPFPLLDGSWSPNLT